MSEANIPAELARALDPIRAKLHDGRNAVLPLVGSGLSRGLPSWTKLLEGLIAEVKSQDERSGLLDDLRKDKYLEVAGELETLLHRARVSAAIEAAYKRPDASKVPAPAVYDLVAALPVTHFSTTNYDPWLKNAVGRRLGEMPQVYVPHDPGAFGDLRVSAPPLVLMLHGDADRAATCVLSEKGYRGLTHFPAYRQALGTLVATRSLLFVGHSLTDPDLRLVLDEWQELFGSGGAPRHWFLGVGLSERIKRQLLERGVMPVEYGPAGDYSQLEPALRHLATPPEAPSERRTSSGAAGRGPSLAEVADVYLRRLDEETRMADLLGIAVAGDALRIELDDVFVPLRVQVMGDRRGDARRKAALARDEVAAFAADRLGGSTGSIVDVLARGPFLAVIGDPGAGKTTLLRWLAHHAGRAMRGDAASRALLGIAEGAESALPLFIPLRHVAAFLPDRGDRPLADDLADAVVAWAEHDHVALPAEALRGALRGRRVLLLLDGLDEIPDAAHRLRAVRAIQHAARCAPQGACAGAIVVTSRPAAYGGATRLDAPFEEARLHDLDGAEVARFLALWVRAVYGIPKDAPIGISPKAEQQLQGVSEAVGASPSLDALSRKPVLLTALALVYHHRGRLPAQRAVLYDEAVTVLLRRFLEHPDHKPPVMRAHLAAVAGHLMDASTPAELRDEEHEEVVAAVIARRLAGLSESAPEGQIPREAVRAAEALVEEQELRAGLLRIGEGKRCRFVHRTFQEYLAAWRLADGREDEVHATVARRLGEPSWRETLRLTAGVLAARGPGSIRRLLEYLIGPQDRVLDERVRGVAAAAMLLEDVEQFDLEPSVLAPIRAERDGLMRLLEDPESPEEVRLGIGAALGWAGDPRLNEAARWVEVPAGVFWRGKGDEDEQAYDWEKPGGRVHVGAHKIERWLVTVDDYARFMVDGKGYVTRAWWSEEGWAGREREAISGPDRWVEQRQEPSNVPVTGVSWWEAEAYCRWRTSVGLGIEAGWVIRLPTEAEWEKAARGGEELPEGKNPMPQRRYPWGDTWVAGNANAENRVQKATPVGIFPGGKGPYGEPWGTWDQAGNVSEWCLDWFDPKAYERQRGRKKWTKVLDHPCVLVEAEAPKVRTYWGDGDYVNVRCRAVRGGAWGSDVQLARVSHRARLEPWRRLDGLGFRCVAARPPEDL